MHIQLQLDEVQVRGRERIETPTHWPVFFAVDDTPLLALAGDIAASSWMHAPGPAPAGSKLAWRYAPGAGRLSPRTQIGYGLMFTAGGADDEATRRAYRILQADIHTLGLGQAARTTGLDALLTAFGGSPDSGLFFQSPDPDRLRKGIDPEELRDELDAGLIEGFEAFQGISDLLRTLLPGGTTGVVRTPSPPSEPGRLPRLPPRRAPPGPVVTVARLAAGAVVAVTVQAWPIEDIPPDRPLEFARPLPTRGVARASLRLGGRLWREP